MPPKLPHDADAWADALQAQLNADDEFAAAAAGFEATFHFVIGPDDAYDGEGIGLTVVVNDGACVAARGSDADADYDFQLAGPYSAWRDLLEDEIDVTAAVLNGPFELDGSKMRLMSNREAVAALVRGAQHVDTAFAY